MRPSVWPARWCGLLLALGCVVIALAPRSHWNVALQHELVAIEGAEGVVMAHLVRQVVPHRLAQLPAGCTDQLALLCALAAQPWVAGCSDLPVHVLARSVLLTLWIGLLAPLSWLASARARLAARAAWSPAAPGALEAARWLLGWLPPCTLIWTGLPDGVAWAPYLAFAWTQGVLYLQGSAGVADRG